MLKPDLFFDLNNFEHRAIFEGIENVWEAFNKVPDYLEKFFSTIPKNERIKGDVRKGAILVGDDIYIAPGAKIEPTAYIEGPTIIGEDSIVGTAAYIRGNTIIGAQSIIGHATEAVSTIMLNHAYAPHFNFIGHSILGNDSNIGAGVILANFRLDAKPVPVGEETTGLIKFGAVLGDKVKIGCNTVLEPGTFMGKDAWIMPNQYFKRGYYEVGKKRKNIIKKI